MKPISCCTVGFSLKHHHSKWARGARWVWPLNPWHKSMQVQSFSCTESVTNCILLHCWIFTIFWVLWRIEKHVEFISSSGWQNAVLLKVRFCKWKVVYFWPISSDFHAENHKILNVQSFAQLENYPNHAVANQFQSTITVRTLNSGGLLNKLSSHIYIWGWFIDHFCQRHCPTQQQ